MVTIYKDVEVHIDTDEIWKEVLMICLRMR